ncbi:MAG: class II aldolase/adducin family protein [FCB group bacterium]|nr:class II aldolase/adducin family protein [FCB group bacterium]
MSKSEMTAEKIVEIGSRLYKRGLIAGTDGNISALIEPGQVMITPAGRSKDRLEPEEMIVIDDSGQKIAGKLRASSEMAMHLYLYSNRPDIFACVHAHPPFATAFAAAGISLNEKILPEIILSVGNIALTEYAPPGTPALPRSLDPFITDHNAFLLKNHGLVTIGSDLEEAYHRLETIEHFARISYLAKRLGGADVLDTDEVLRLEAIRKSTIED